MARVSDARWMERFAEAEGSQKAAAEKLGVSPSTVSKVIAGVRSGERYREAAKAGAQGKPVTPALAPPTAKTPKNVRRPARMQLPGGRARVATKSPRVLGREVTRSVSAGRVPSGFVVTATVYRADGYVHRGASGAVWSGPLHVPDLTEDDLERLRGGDAQAIIDVVRQHHPWVGDMEIDAVTYEDWGPV